MTMNFDFWYEASNTGRKLTRSDLMKERGH